MIKIRYKKFNKVIIHIMLVLFAFLLQTSIFPLLPFFSCSPNFLLIITFSYGLFYGEYIGMFTGFFCGLISDMYFNGEFGLYILIYTLIGYFNGKLKRIFFEDTITFPMMLAIANGCIYNLYIYVTQFLIRKRFNLLGYVFAVILPNVLFTLIVTVLIYKILYRFNEKTNKLI